MKFLLALCLIGLASAAVPLTYRYNYGAVPYAGLPLTYTVPVVHPGYVAKTPGATHIAPLPEGLAYASHHINEAAAPGTV